MGPIIISLKINLFSPWYSWKRKYRLLNIPLLLDNFKPIKYYTGWAKQMLPLLNSCQFHNNWHISFIFSRDFPGRNPPSCPCRSWLTTVSFIFIPNTSCFPELFQETPDCEFAGRISHGKVPPELSLNEDYRFRCKICLHNLSLLLHSVSSCWIHGCFGMKI